MINWNNSNYLWGIFDLKIRNGFQARYGGNILLFLPLNPRNNYFAVFKCQSYFLFRSCGSTALFLFLTITLNTAIVIIIVLIIIIIIIMIIIMMMIIVIMMLTMMVISRRRENRTKLLLLLLLLLLLILLLPTTIYLLYYRNNFVVFQ